MIMIYFMFYIYFKQNIRISIIILFFFQTNFSHYYLILSLISFKVLSYLYLTLIFHCLMILLLNILLNSFFYEMINITFLFINLSYLLIYILCLI